MQSCRFCGKEDIGLGHGCRDAVVARQAAEIIGHKPGCRCDACFFMRADIEDDGTRAIFAEGGEG